MILTLILLWSLPEKCQMSLQCFVVWNEGRVIYFLPVLCIWNKYFARMIRETVQNVRLHWDYYYPIFVGNYLAPPVNGSAIGRRDNARNVWGKSTWKHVRHHFARCSLDVVSADVIARWSGERNRLIIAPSMTRMNDVDRHPTAMTVFAAPRTHACPQLQNDGSD